MVDILKYLNRLFQVLEDSLVKIVGILSLLMEYVVLLTFIDIELFVQGDILLNFQGLSVFFNSRLVCHLEIHLGVFEAWIEVLRRRPQVLQRDDELLVEVVVATPIIKTFNNVEVCEHEAVIRRQLQRINVNLLAHFVVRIVFIFEL